MELGLILSAMSRNRTRVALLVLEIAFTMVIVLNALNMIFEQRRLMERPSGVDEKNLIAATVRPYGTDYEERDYRLDVMDRDLVALRAMPGVVDATPITNFPLQGGGSSFQLRRMGAPDSELVRAPLYYADSHVLGALGLELASGRTFSENDVPTTTGPQILNVLVTQDLADALFPDGDAVGQLVDTGSEEYPDRIVGVIRHMLTPYGGGPMESRILFYPGKPSSSSSFQYLVRTEPGAISGLMPEVETTLLGTQPDRVVETQTLLEVKGGGYGQNRLVMKILSVVVFLLLFVTALGIYAATSFSVTQRTKQVGTRRALGATRGAILGYFLLEATLIAAIGMTLGLVGAYGFNVLLVSELAGTKLDLWMVAACVLGLWLLVLAASLAPARRAAGLSPALATRTV